MTLLFLFSLSGGAPACEGILGGDQSQSGHGGGRSSLSALSLCEVGAQFVSHPPKLFGQSAKCRSLRLVNGKIADQLALRRVRNELFEPVLQVLHGGPPLGDLAGGDAIQRFASA